MELVFLTAILTTCRCVDLCLSFTGLLCLVGLGHCLDSTSFQSSAPHVEEDRYKSTQHRLHVVKIAVRNTSSMRVLNLNKCQFPKGTTVSRQARSVSIVFNQVTMQAIVHRSSHAANVVSDITRCYTDLPESRKPGGKKAMRRQQD